MSRINIIGATGASPRAQQLLEGVHKALGMTPNMMKTMAHSPAVLEGYLSWDRTLSRGAFDAKFREQIALTVAQANACDYCLSAHTALGKAAGLGNEDLAAAREGNAQNQKAEAGLVFVQEIVGHRGHVSDETLARVRQAGYGDGEIAELIANAALNIFTNYFNVVSQTEVDFPLVQAKAA
jgi:AhpD family alkylhydroperoxidase